MKITKNESDIAEFSYDALGRRVEKQDCATSGNTRRFYHNYKWQVLSEYDGANTYVQSFVYGNYIDELLYSAGDDEGSERYYVHDHLFSTVAAINSNGAVAERYEYDAYGACHVLDYDFIADADNVSDHGNPYLFTGRRLNILNNKNLRIYYYRNRYYDPHTGRFLTHDPLGITPNRELAANPSEAQTQYASGANLYDYVQDMPLARRDPYGLWHYDDPPQVRKNKARAWVLPDEDEAVYDVDGLASFVRLEPKEFGKWAKYKQVQNKCGWEVPNTAYVNKGDVSVRGPDWPFSQLMEKELGDIKAHFEWSGFHVIRTNRPGQSNVQKQFGDENIIAWAFAGHGKESSGTLMLDEDLEWSGKDAKESTHHRLAEVILYACDAGKDMDWMDVISKYGILYAADFSFRPAFRDWEDLPESTRP